MPKRRVVSFVVACFLASLTTAVRAAELWVDGSAGGAGNGSFAYPFPTINNAIAKAIGGDTITVRKGTYHESVIFRLSGTPGHPTILRAAAGERVILSGFAPIADWKAQANGIYTATVEDPVKDLYVGVVPQPVARWPSLDQPPWLVKNPDPTAGTFQDAQPLAQDPLIKQVAAAPESAMACIWASLNGNCALAPITAINETTISVASKTAFENVKAPAAHYQIINHPALIESTGQWAFATIDEAHTKVYFKPVRPEDLQNAQYRQASPAVLIIPDRTHDVRVEGLEVCGSANYGIQVDHAANVTVTRCLAHDNAANGISCRRSRQILFKDDISVANESGLTIASSQDCVIEGNEIAFNANAAISIAGNVTGLPEGEPNSTGITIRNSYIHHQITRSFSSFIQLASDVSGVKLQDDLFLYEMGTVTVPSLRGASAANCIFAGGNTLLFDPAGQAIVVSPKDHKIHFSNAPFCQTITGADDANRADHLAFWMYSSTDYQKDDLLEVNGDGVVRHVTAVKPNWVDFAPPLARRPLGAALLWNWKNAATASPDFRQNGPDGKPTGVTLDVAAYQRGEFYANGKRLIPKLPEDLQAALAGPDLSVLPPYGH